MDSYVAVTTWLLYCNKVVSMRSFTQLLKAVIEKRNLGVHVLLSSIGDNNWSMVPSTTQLCEKRRHISWTPCISSNTPDLLETCRKAKNTPEWYRTDMI